MIRKKLINVLNKIGNMELNLEEASSEVSLIEDCGFDSIKIVEMIATIESEFDICFDDEDLEIENLDSINKLIDIIENKQCE